MVVFDLFLKKVHNQYHKALPYTETHKLYVQLELLSNKTNWYYM